MDYKFAGDFSKAPLGPFTNANKKLVWPGLTDDFDPNGTKFEIVEDSRFPGGKACRMFYPKGQYGMQNQSYAIRIKSPQTICNIEWLWLWEPNFSFYTPNVGSKDGGGGKLGPCINWGEIGGETSKRGTRCMIWFNSHGSKKDNECHNPSCQDQRSGNQLIQPVVYSKKIVTDAIYKFRIQMRGGPDGFAKYWITYPGDQTETLLGECHGKNMMATATDDVIYDFAYFSGGNDPAYSPEWDSYARNGGIRYWSGEAYWAEEGNGGGDTIDGGGGTEPTPPVGATTPYHFAVDETRIFRAKFLDNDTLQEIPAQGDVTWNLNPNIVTWGAQAGPKWSALKVVGKTPGKAMLVATDPVTKISTVPIEIEVTAEREPTPPLDLIYVIGTCVVEMP